MTDDAFLTAVAAGEEPHDHVSNLRLAWLLVSRDPASAEAELFNALGRRAERTGGCVHHTRTAAWLVLVRSAGAALGAPAGFDELLARRHELLDRHVLERYYDPATLREPGAASCFVPPDRRPLPDLHELVAAR